MPTIKGLWGPPPVPDGSIASKSVLAFDPPPPRLADWMCARASPIETDSALSTLGALDSSIVNGNGDAAAAAAVALTEMSRLVCCPVKMLYFTLNSLVQQRRLPFLPPFWMSSDANSKHVSVCLLYSKPKQFSLQRGLHLVALLNSPEWIEPEVAEEQ